jgi:hypothetical protein
MSEHQKQNECPACERGFNLIQAGGPCPTCQHCCDCCSCNTPDFGLMHEEVRALYDCHLIELFAEDDPFSIAPKTDPDEPFHIDLFDKNMVKIAIWPYSMEDDEIVFDPETGKLTEEVAQKVEHYLRLNRAMIPPDEEVPPELEA